jgi:hypothetical protein
MSFWNLTDGETAVTNEKEYEQETGNFDPIPDGSNVLAFIEEAKWDTAREGGAEFISLKWSIDDPDQYRNRKVFHKLWVTDDDPNAKDADKAAKKRDKAKRMLAAIDANCGGKLARNARQPSNDDLALALQDKPMVIKCMVWEMETNGQMNSGNWIAAVFPKSKGVSIPEGAAPAKKPATKTAVADDLGDDVPFD